tara:strand:- start:402 stop:1274 length:873 start_codon:yes stop_codon:yes gene_type:complete
LKDKKGLEKIHLFFLVGAQKSGSTWLQKSLNSIHGFHCLGEGHFIDKFLIPIAQTRHEYNKMMKIVNERVYEGNGFYKEIPSEEFIEYMRSWIFDMMLRNCNQSIGSVYALGDKTPANSFHIRTLKILFPDCKFIHLLRDGRDACVSAYYHRKRILEKNGQQSKNIDELAPQLLSKWAEFTKSVLDAEKSGINMCTVRYEDMLVDNLAVLRQCINHIMPENQVSDIELQESIRANSFTKMTGGRKSGEVQNESFVRRGQSGSWKDELQETTQNSFNQDDIDLLKKLGYIC